MATTFSFADDTLVTSTQLISSQLTKGGPSNVNDPSQFSAVAPSQAIDVGGDVDVFAISLVAGRTYTFDVDDGAGDSSSVDTQLDLINAAGGLVTSSDDGGATDAGSASGLDPLLTVSVNQTGIYYIAVHAYDADYNNNAFSFNTGSSTLTGDYQLVVSTPTLPASQSLTNGNDNRSFGGPAQSVQALDGNDTVSMGDGADFAHGNAGNDTLYGGDGSDELVGGSGNDKLNGDDDDDILVGGDGNDVVLGDSNKDNMSGDAGNDRLEGGTSSDTIWGDEGNDSIVGGDGDDFIRGGLGVDTMKGGPDADRFHFLRGEASFDEDGFNEDKIVDFDTSDLFDLSDVYSGTLGFRGSSSFSGSNQVRIENFRASDGSGFQEVQVNLDSNTSTVELAVLVDTNGNFTLSSGDFIL